MDHGQTTIRSVLIGALNELHPRDPIHDAGRAVISALRTDPAAVRAIAYRKLHAFPFSQVPTCWRRVFEEACLWEIIKLIENSNRGGQEANTGKPRQWIDSAIRLCDAAIIFAGCPGRRDVVGAVLDALDETKSTSNVDVDEIQEPNAKRRRLESTDRASLKSQSSIPATFEQTDSPIRELVLNPQRVIKRSSPPSLTRFKNHMMQHAGPLIISDVVSTWPAHTRWSNPQYWLEKTHNGRRLVPIELGSKYTDDSWGQKIMTFGEYLTKHLLGNQGRSNDALSTSENGPNPKTSRVGYLAQHDLLSQVPSLRNDILIPDYCYLPTPKAEAHRTQNHDATPSAEDSLEEEDDDEPAEPLMNMWLGPGSTISPAHTDPHENILCQVVGKKYVRLFAPSEGEKMYPIGTENHNDAEEQDRTTETSTVDMQNTSRVDVGLFVNWKEPSAGSRNLQRRRRSRELTRFPEHAMAEYYEGVLEAGECLYIPMGWWHYIESLGGVSCSVSFWWD